MPKGPVGWTSLEDPPALAGLARGGAEGGPQLELALNDNVTSCDSQGASRDSPVGGLRDLRSVDTIVDASVITTVHKFNGTSYQVSTCTRTSNNGVAVDCMSWISK